MAADIDQKLIKCGILEKLKLNSKKYINVKESKNLLAIFEQHIFIWHDTGSCILTAEVNNNAINETVERFGNSNQKFEKSEAVYYKVLIII